MKSSSKFLLSSSIVLLALFALNSIAQSRQRPQLRTDSTPPDRSNQHRVNNYADVLDKVTPAVVGVFTSQLVTSRSGSTSPLEEYLRQYFNRPAPPGRNSTKNARFLPVWGQVLSVSPDTGCSNTNNHVVTQNGEVVDEIVVKLTDGREFNAKVMKADAPTDVAILKVDASNLPTAVITDSNHLRVSDVSSQSAIPSRWVQPLRWASVSAAGRTNLGLLGGGGYENFIQTDASINMGNSGGALVDSQGRLIGINTAIMSRTGGNIGLGFSIPINLARNVMGSLVDKGVVERGAIGVMLEGMTQEMAANLGLSRPVGALVRQVVPGKAGAKAGLRDGDVILKVNGQDIEDYAQLRLIISQKAPGTRVELDILRNKTPRSIQVVLGSLGGLTANLNPNEWPIPGLELESVTSQYRNLYGIPKDVEGVVVSSIHDSYDFGRQITEGTVICEINGEQSTSVAKAQLLIRSGVNRLYVWRKGIGYRFIAIRKE